MNITSISINRPTLIIVLFSIITLLGIIGYNQLSYELMPDFNQPVVVIKTIYPGAEPEEVENSVSKKIEDALANLEGVDFLVTKSLPNASVVIANLKYGTSLDKTMQDAQRYIDNIKKDLPDDVQSPEMSKVSPNDLPIMSISSNSSWKGKEFYQKMKDEFLPQIQQIKGVSEITLLGGEEKEIQILVNPKKLQFYQLSFPLVVEQIKKSSLDLPSGKIKTQKENTSIRLLAQFKNIEEIGQVRLSSPQSSLPIYLKDIAQIVDATKEQTSYSRFNGKEGIGLLIKKQGDANAVEVSSQVKEKLKQIEQQYNINGNQQVSFHIADDSTDNTIAAVNSVAFDLLLAVILVALVMLLFLGNFRNAFIVLVAIPTSLMTAFAVMWILGYTLNLMTLLAMSLIIGILVDDATVVLENIQKHLDKGKDKRLAAMDGRMEIGFSAISITLVDVVVFLPILFLQVFVADMLKQFSIVVITSTLTSLLVGFTLTPWLASRIGKKEELKPSNWMNKIIILFERFIYRLTEWYGRQLVWVLHHKIVFSVIIFVLFVFTLMIMKMQIIGKELISTGDQGKFKMTLELDKTTSVEENKRISIEIEKILLKEKEIKSVFSNIGGPSSGIGSVGIGRTYITELSVQLKDKKITKVESTEQYMIDLRRRILKQIPGIQLSIATLGLIPRSAPIELTISSPNEEELFQTSSELISVINKVAGADNVQLSVEEGNPELQLTPNREKMQLLGLQTATVAYHLRTAYAGNEDMTLTEKGTEFPIRIQLGEQYRANIEDIMSLSMTNQKGVPIALNQVLEMKLAPSPSLLERKDRQKAVTITADALGRPSGSVADEVISYINKNPLPNTINLTWGSDIKRQQDSFGALGNVLIISFLLIYLIMVALYDSFVYPFVVLFSIPVAIIGAFLALNLSLSHLSLFALLGLIMLMGLVVKNAILIVDFARQLLLTGLSLEESLIKAGKERLRPILMTTLSMIIGMLPIALAKGTASEWKNGLAWVIIGGLSSSLILTIYLVPMMFYLIEKIRKRGVKKL
ncbi:MAG: efflux RND transporter permease subunit [Flavobacteriia bacterium]|nr:efflux RND transporter permease subunit [Flavobacteriia bacterium]